MGLVRDLAVVDDAHDAGVQHARDALDLAEECLADARLGGLLRSKHLDGDLDSLLAVHGAKHFAHATFTDEFVEIEDAKGCGLCRHVRKGSALEEMFDVFVHSTASTAERKVSSWRWRVQRVIGVLG